MSAKPRSLWSAFLYRVYSRRVGMRKVQRAKAWAEYHEHPERCYQQPGSQAVIRARRGAARTGGSR